MQTRVLLCSFVLLAGCATRSNDPNAPRELLPDPTFAYWFSIRGLGQPADDGQVKGVFRTSGKVGKPSWTLAQWASKHSFADSAVTRQVRLGTHLFSITNASKRVTVDSQRGEIELGLFASACYDRPRQKNEPWPHLLASTALTDTRYPSESCRVETLKRLDVSMECRLTEFADKNPVADPDLHAAQFQLFLYVQNLTQGDDGFGDMLWFGIPVFDNRRPQKEETYQRDGGKPDASGKFIYSLPSKACLPQGSTFFAEVIGKPAASGAGTNQGVTGTLNSERRTPNAEVIGKGTRWTNVRVDAAPWIVYAFKLARRNGYLANTELKDLYVSGLNFGWEMPGAFDAVMQVRGFSLLATPLPPPTLKVER
jgi:hypothetical protein